MKTKITKSQTAAEHYINTDAKWGKADEVTAEDYLRKAQRDGFEINTIEIEDDGIYVDGYKVAEPAEA